MLDYSAWYFRFYPILWGLLLSVTISACGGGSSGGGSTPTTPPTTPPPPANTAPQLSGPSTFAYDENEGVAFDLQASDAEGQAVTFTLQSSDDSAFFSVDPDSGRVVDTTAAGMFDFENPQDQNSDNTYEFTVVLSDGDATTSAPISVTINDVDGPLICSTGDTVTVTENATGLFYTFVASKPDSEFSIINFDLIPSVTRQGGGIVTENMLTSLSYRSHTGELSLFHALNAESEGDLGNAYTISTTATLDQETVDCSVNLVLEDLEDEVLSGIKFSGSYPDTFDFRPRRIGDLDGDGLSEMWLGSRKQYVNLPWDHQGHVVFGQVVRDELAQDGAEEMLMSALDSTNSVKVSGSFPQVHPLRYIGNDLIAREVGDIDGDGRSELLLALHTPITAMESAFAGRPLAYLLWGDELLSQADGEIDLNTLTADEGLLLDGLDGIDRRGNSVASGDFDGDGIPDVVVGIPVGTIQATATSRYRGQVFVVFGSYIRAMKPVGSIDLLEDVGSLDPSEVLLLTAEDEDDVISAPPELPLLSGSGSELMNLPDMSGDGADELIVTGTSVEQNTRNVAVISSQAILGARAGTGLLEYEDISADEITVLRSSGRASVSRVAGDSDGDGGDELFFGKPDYFENTALAALVTSDALEGIPDGTVMDVDLPTSSALLFSRADHSSYQASTTFIGDLDGDGRDDLGIAYIAITPTGGGAPDGMPSFSIILASALENVAQDQTFFLDQMSPGDGLHLVDSSEKGIELEVAPIGDVDGDNTPDLLISSKALRRESYLVRGADLYDAIQSGALTFDLHQRFENASAN